MKATSSWSRKARTITRSRSASKTAAVVILTAAPDAKIARRLAEGLVSRKLAACVTSIPGCESVYRWKSKTERTRETVLLIKTVLAKFADVERFIKKEHPYELPEVIAVEAGAGSSEYLEWMRKNTV